MCEGVREGFTEERKSVSGSSGFTITIKKGPSDFGRRRGRMIDSSNRKRAVGLIQEVNLNGARLAKACEELDISVRAYERWIKEDEVQLDKRPTTTCTQK